MKPDVSIVIPAYDESSRITGPLDVILNFLEVDMPNAEIIVVDDGSSDDTAEVAGRALATKPNITSRVIRYNDNRGKGFAVRTGLLAATADIAIFSDADLSTPITELNKLVDP